MPDWKEEIRRRLTDLKLEPSREAEIIEELAQHLEDRYSELLAGGATDEQASSAVLAELRGSPLLANQLHRVERSVTQEPLVWGSNWRTSLLGGLRRDVRFGARMLIKRPGFSLIAIITLALGIGANTSIFSLVQAVLLRPLPLREPERLVTFWLSAPAKGLEEVNLTQALFAFYRDHSETFEGMAAYDTGSATLTGSASEPERLNNANVTFNYFQVLGQSPLYGRTFTESEDTPGNNHVAIISHELWQRRFGGDPIVLDKPIRLNNEAFVLVGIMPPGFDYPHSAERSDFRHIDLWLPLGLDTQNNSYWNYSVTGRLKPGVTLAQAQSEMVRLGHQEGEADIIVVMMPLMERIIGRVQTPVLMLMGAVGFVLLIACANIANLMLVRAAARYREMAIRCCLGASRRRIVAQMLIESVLLGVLGAGLGLLLAAWVINGIKLLSSASIPRLDQARLNPTVLLFTLAAALLTSVLCGLAPALRAARVDLQEALKETARSTASRASRRLNSAFVIAQIALSLVLLIGAGLLLKSFRNLLAVDPGFRAENVLSGRLELPENEYKTAAQVRTFYGQLLERVERLPGVRFAGLCQVVPFSGGGDGDEFTIEGHEPGRGDPVPVAWYRNVTPGYFAAMGIPILKGRAFDYRDTEMSQRVAIVDEKIARTYWPDEDPVGKRIRVGRASRGNPWLTIVGVVKSVKNRHLDEDARFYLYEPFAQSFDRETFLVMRTTNDPEGMIPIMRQQVAVLDPQLPLYQVETAEQAIARSVGARRLTNLLLACFAVTALLLAMLGIYGVVSLNVSSRINEFGIRMALGAQTGDVLKLVVQQGMRLTLIGVAVGLAAALVLTRLMTSLLYNVAPCDPLTFTVISVLLTLVALVACYLPARGAARVDPLVALRYE
jgi:putative ABC transport system permease protein